MVVLAADVVATMLGVAVVFTVVGDVLMFADAIVVVAMFTFVATAVSASAASAAATCIC